MHGRAQNAFFQTLDAIESEIMGVFFIFIIIGCSCSFWLSLLELWADLYDLRWCARNAMHSRQGTADTRPWASECWRWWIRWCSKGINQILPSCTITGKHKWGDDFEETVCHFHVWVSLIVLQGPKRVAVVCHEDFAKGPTLVRSVSSQHPTCLLDRYTK